MEQPSITWPVVDQIAGELGASEAARRKWRNSSRRVPWEWRVKIAAALAERGHHFDIASFEGLASNPGRIAA